jgi:hypothetical protein
VESHAQQQEVRKDRYSGKVTGYSGLGLKTVTKNQNHRSRCTEKPLMAQDAPNASISIGAEVFNNCTDISKQH